MTVPVIVGTVLRLAPTSDLASLPDRTASAETFDFQRCWYSRHWQWCSSVGRNGLRASFIPSIA